MAESKSVADQQQEAQELPRRDGGRLDAAAAVKRRKLELARVAVLRQLEAAQAEAHREMLRRALAALDKDLAGDLSGH